MAVLLKYGSLIPIAVRVGLAGGAVYGTVKSGIWTDSSQSREKLDRLKQSMHREIEYPKTVFKYTNSKPGKYPVTSLTADSDQEKEPWTTSLLSSAIRGWNRTVTNMCHYLATVDGSTALSVGGRGQDWIRKLYK